MLPRRELVRLMLTGTRSTPVCVAEPRSPRVELPRRNFADAGRGTTELSVIGVGQYHSAVLARPPWE